MKSHAILVLAAVRHDVRSTEVSIPGSHTYTKIYSKYNHKTHTRIRQQHSHSLLKLNVFHMSHTCLSFTHTKKLYANSHYHEL